MRIPFIAGNWKMFKTVHEAVVFVKELRSFVKDITDVEIVVAPPFTAVHAVAEAARNTSIGVATQDLYWEREGAFTGEISPFMVKEAGAEYAIVGHSERRRLFGETDQTINRKAVAALGAGLVPIVCIGETLEERERNQTHAVLDRQLRDGLDGLTPGQVTSSSSRTNRSGRSAPGEMPRPRRPRTHTAISVGDCVRRSAATRQSDAS